MKYDYAMIVHQKKFEFSRQNQHIRCLGKYLNFRAKIIIFWFQYLILFRQKNTFQIFKSFEFSRKKWLVKLQCWKMRLFFRNFKPWFWYFITDWHFLLDEYCWYTLFSWWRIWCDQWCWSIFWSHNWNSTHRVFWSTICLWTDLSSF